MTLSTNLGGPRDPNVPMESLEEWCAYHGVPLVEGAPEPDPEPDPAERA
ncbi:hypothetical protein [Cyanobium sp. N5-Cardenillas]|nr:hypothetical protein [Cyanobium sp. N5-Cardenillas]MCP9786002.1 hypothetical protein [Cyanobium sp. N5-Cardenillas]